jgi:hypothetical protein
MNIQEYDLVALTQDCMVTHKETHQPILLRRGQIGTVLTLLNPEACLIDFADTEGKTYAMETIPTSRLLLLFQQPISA